MWTADVLLRKGPSEHVLIGLAQARHHLVQAALGSRSELNLGVAIGHAPIRRLALIGQPGFFQISDYAGG